jgi:hypothetical protein
MDRVALVQVLLPVLRIFHATDYFTVSPTHADRHCGMQQQHYEIRTSVVPRGFTTDPACDRKQGSMKCRIVNLKD